MVAKNARREKSRAIESNDRRIVHFIFDPQQPVEKTPFCQKFSQLMAGAAELGCDIGDCSLMWYPETTQRRLSQTDMR